MIEQNEDAAVSDERISEKQPVMNGREDTEVLSALKIAAAVVSTHVCLRPHPGKVTVSLECWGELAAKEAA